MLHGCTRLAVKLGLHRRPDDEGAEIDRRAKFRGSQANIGEVIAYRNLFWSLLRGDGATPTRG